MKNGEKAAERNRKNLMLLEVSIELWHLVIGGSYGDLN
jgi:hypothetical protein